MFFILNQNNENIKQQINGINAANIMQKKQGAGSREQGAGGRGQGETE
ncbi:MAG: hypothetical protein JW965_02760 [Bacteroidales bacterium]|nr:hypothetical protein [Bacteroidales bacterium]